MGKKNLIGLACSLSVMLALWVGCSSDSSTNSAGSQGTEGIESSAAESSADFSSPSSSANTVASSAEAKQPGNEGGDSSSSVEEVATSADGTQSRDNSGVSSPSSTGVSSSSVIVPQTSSQNEPQSSSLVTPQSSSQVKPQSSSQVVPSSSQTAPQSSSVEPPQSSSEAPLNFDFFTGADISTVQEYERNNTKFYDVDGTEGDIFMILKKHGFNAIRLRTFVSPLANYGYAAKSSECGHSGDEAYGDKEHIIAYAKKIKAAGMAFLLDIHYSDNWADPGKQIIPERWRNVTNSDAMADSVYEYTKDLMTSLKNAGATPEMVQIGNETTPGILIHVPSGSTDCWGNNPTKASTAINGDMGTDAGKANAAKYFKAGVKAVKDVSPETKTSFHIERIRKPETVTWWMGVIFDEKKISVDAMGFSAYTAYGDGGPSAWKSLFNTLGSKYPKLQFFIAEYNGGDSKNHYNYDGSRKQTNEMVRGMDRWIGTFFWEPTLGGEWGPALFDWNGNSLKANAKAFEEFK